MKMLHFGVVALALAGVSSLSAPALAADEGQKVFEEVCSQCHTPEQRPLTDKHMTREEWRAKVEEMIGLGADVPKKKIEPLLDYLARTHGPQTTPAPASK